MKKNFWKNVALACVLYGGVTDNSALYLQAYQALQATEAAFFGVKERR